jgi:LPS-assembly protein
MAGLPRPRPLLPRWRRLAGAFALFLIAALAVGTEFRADGASAQTLTFPHQPPRAQKSGGLKALIPEKNIPGKGQEQMLVRADEIQYDYTNQRVAAVGHVQIYYARATLEANKVIYDQKSKRLHAEGNVILVEANGRITYGEIIDLSDDFRNGFVDSLRLDTPDETRFAAARAQRSGGRFTVFESGVYTACKPCIEDPRKPPLWQIKGARIIHDETEKMIYFESARLEFFGLPIAYLPYFSVPDPTVKRKSGFLMPTVSSNPKYGSAAVIPYYWALAPDYDITFSPMITTKQGPLLEAEWRQRTVNGSYYIRGAGIFQLDKNYFRHSDGTPTPGFRDSRGSLESAGQFRITNQWVWGWEAHLLSDKSFLQDYNLLQAASVLDPFQAPTTEAVSQLYLSGRGERSFFDVRTIYYYGFSESDNQNRLPVIHPVLDYDYTFDHPVFGGELSYKANFTSLSRTTASFDPISKTAYSTGLCTTMTANPAVKIPANCLLRGVPGTYTRFSGIASWRRTIVDPYGQIFTPFISVRADVAEAFIQNEAGVSNYIAPGDATVFRVMPTVGVEYRYPFISVHSWGTQIIEPIAQLIVRPNEGQIGKLPNEDAQSLIFDDSNLFRIDKFSGWDRVEGGGRLNAGMQYTVQFNKAGFVNMLFGQSYQLFGTNSFAVGDITNTGVNTGLETARSDYVARLSYQPNGTYTFSTRFRFDEQTFAVRRFELEARTNFGRWNFTALYGNYDAQPQLGFLTRRQGILGIGQVKLTQNWALLGGLRYDLDADKIDQTRLGVGYIDDCLILAVNYITNYAYSGNPTTVHQVTLQMTLRTLGGPSSSQALSSQSLAGQ